MRANIHTGYANVNAHVTIEHSFYQVFNIDNCKACLLTIDANTVIAVFMPFPDVFKIFYSHSLNMHGLPCEHGYSVLISVEGVQNLVNISDCSETITGTILVVCLN